MKITILEPHGYCQGVLRAIKIATNSINDNTIKKPIYLLGNLIHNKIVTQKLNNLGIITISDNSRTRLDMLDDIKSGTVIFSAHGVSNKVREKAKSKGLDIVDASCGKVIVIHKKVLDYISKGYTVLYIGKEKHPECEAILDESKDIQLIKDINDINLLNINNKNIYITNQTTLSNIETENIYKKLLEIYPYALIDNNICNATTIRQKAVMNQPKADLLIVVGDKLSSNSSRLKEISEQYSNIKSILVENEDDITLDMLKNIESINITSGASTPEDVLNKVVEKIQKISQTSSI